ncbi:MAG: gamma-glutamyltransferase, partial [Terriglobales bacterium]
LPDVLYLEGTGFSPDTEARLRQMGYHLKIGGHWCDTEAVWVNPKTGAYRAVTDPRADGTAMAY